MSYFDKSKKIFEIGLTKVRVSFSKEGIRDQLEGELIAVDTKPGEGYVMLKNGMVPWDRVISIERIEA